MAAPLEALMNSVDALTKDHAAILKTITKQAPIKRILKQLRDHRNEHAQKTQQCAMAMNLALANGFERFKQCVKEVQKQRDRIVGLKPHLMTVYNLLQSDTGLRSRMTTFATGAARIVYDDKPRERGRVNAFAKALETRTARPTHAALLGMYLCLVDVF